MLHSTPEPGLHFRSGQTILTSGLSIILQAALGLCEMSSTTEVNNISSKPILSQKLLTGPRTGLAQEGDSSHLIRGMK